MKIFTLGWALTVIPAFMLAAPTTTMVSGAVKTIAGKALRAALTIHDLGTDRTPGHIPFDRQFASKSDGSFSLPAVPPGKYEICVEAPLDNVLDPCIWAPGAGILNLSGSAPMTGVAIKVDTGYMLQVHVNDPLSLLPSKATAAAAINPLSLVVITKERRYQNLKLLNAGSTSQDHYVLVPFDESLTLSVSSSTVGLSDDKNQRYGNDSFNIPVRVPSGKSVPPVVVNIGKH